MRLRFRAAMDGLYWLCVVVSGSALVLISAVIPWGVFTRYVLNSAASWPEPMAILLTIVLTFIGAAACYRADTHMRVSILVRAMSISTGWRARLPLMVPGMNSRDAVRPISLRRSAATAAG